MRRSHLRICPKHLGPPVKTSDLTLWLRKQQPTGTQVSFSLLRRFGVQFYTQRPYNLENGVEVGAAFA
jgi:hypothetical protein